MRYTWLIFSIVACRFPEEHFTADDPACRGSVVRVCFAASPPASPVVLTNDTDIDTDTSPMCDQDNDQMAAFCVVAGGDFTLASTATIRAHGSKSLVLLSTGTIDLKATIDVSSKSTSASIVGAGGNPSTCTPGTDSSDGGGGYGGSFGGRGGAGKGVPSPGGLPATPLPGAPGLRGGCPGGGGRYGLNGLAGAGGSGGGAIALVATKILLDGRVNASGAGGQGGPQETKSGGGGGGSGGMIVLDAPAIISGLDGWLFANGGGGGQGGVNFGSGLPGGESPEPTVAALGGTTPGPSGDGGAGSSGASLEGQDALDEVSPNGDGGGGGGGGGGAGFIHAPGVNPMGVAPPSTVL